MTKDFLSSKFKNSLRENHVKLAYLFGSTIRGEAHQESDVDIAVLFDQNLKREEYLLREGKLIEIFSSVIPNKEINIVNLNIASPLLKQTVVLEGELLYIKDRLDQIFFQMQTLREYEEYTHLSYIYNQAMDLKIKAL
jgi:predicted nucleotidyltransferase